MVRPLSLLVFVLLAGCGTLGSDRAIDEAEEVVAQLPCAPSASQVACMASDRTLYFVVSARAYLSEAVRRSRHGDHAQAERFAVLARKSAEAALRNQDGL